MIIITILHAPDGIRALIENLPKIEYIHNQGKMGAMISSQKLRLPEYLNCFPLKEFCQMESITSGGQEEDEDEITGLKYFPSI